jgi:hypothetical protein
MPDYPPLEGPDYFGRPDNPARWYKYHPHSFYLKTTHSLSSKNKNINFH